MPSRCLVRGATALIAVALLSAGSFSSSARADDHDIDAARAVVLRHASAVVSVGGVATIDMMTPMGAMPQEQAISALGTIVDASGLAVVPLAVLDPFPGGAEMEAGPGMTIEMTFDVDELWFEFADGSRATADIALKDETLGVALVKPRLLSEAQLGMISALDCAAAARGARILDPVIALDRLDKRLGHAPSVMLGRINAVIEQPWAGYQCPSAPGGPVFNGAGTFLGVAVVPTSEDADPSAMLMGGGLGLAGTPLVLPATSLVDLVKQALRGREI